MKFNFLKFSNPFFFKQVKGEDVMTDVNIMGDIINDPDPVGGGGGLPLGLIPRIISGPTPRPPAPAPEGSGDSGSCGKGGAGDGGSTGGGGGPGTD
jgi:hypothetical protein